MKRQCPIELAADGMTIGVIITVLVRISFAVFAKKKTAVKKGFQRDHKRPFYCWLEK